MGVKVNETGQERKLFTGIASCTVLAVNPSKAELETFKIKTDKEQVYMSKDKKEDKNQLRLSFLLEFKIGQETHRTGYSIFIKDKIRTDIWLNKTGNFGKEKEKIGDDSKNPYDGEIELVNFISTLCNTKKGDEVSIDTIETMIKVGNVKELKDIVKRAKGNNIKLLLGVSPDGKYQRIYNRKIERGYSTDFSYLHKDMVKNQQYIKDDFGPIDLVLYSPNDFRLREWTGEGFAMASASPEASTSSATSATSASQSLPDTQQDADGGETTDDLPF